MRIRLPHALLALALSLGPQQALVTAAAAQSAETENLTPSQAEQLHQGILELRRLQRQNDRAGAIEVGEKLQHRFPDNRRVEDALLDLYRMERRDDKLMALLARRVERDPNALDEARELCTLLMLHKRTPKALDVLQQVIAASPKDEARYRMAAALLRSHSQLDLAASFYRQGRKAIGREALFAAELAQLAEQSHDEATAIAEYMLLVMDPDQRHRARRKIIRMLAAAEDPEAMRKSIETLRDRHPKSAAVHDVAAVAYLQMGRLDQALAAVRQADRYAEDQGEHFLEFGRLALTKPEGKPVDLERTRLGVRVLHLLPEVHPQSNLIPETSRLLAEGLVTVARQAPDSTSRRELLQEAVRSLDSSYRDSRFPVVQRDALALKGLILFEDLGQFEAALESFRALATFLEAAGEPDQLARVQMGLCLVALGRFAEARTLLDAVSAEPARPEASRPPQHPSLRKQGTPEEIGRARARYLLAQLDLIEGEYDKARDGFAALAEEAPEDRLANDCLDLALTVNEATFQADSALARYGSYQRALLRRQPELARRELETLVREHPESGLGPLALFDLAQNLVTSGLYDAALQRFAALVAAHPEHRLAPRALEAMADVQLQHLAKLEMAIANYERILLDYPEDLFQDDVRKKLLAARETLKGENATP